MIQLSLLILRINWFSFVEEPLMRIPWNLISKLHCCVTRNNKWHLWLIENNVFSSPLAPILEHKADFLVPLIIFTDGRTPWTGDQLVSRPLPKHRTTQTQNKRMYIPNIHALCGIRTHDPGFRESEDSICLRQLDYRERRKQHYLLWMLTVIVFRIISFPTFVKRDPCQQ
jgi:hypothetical protein